MTETQTPRFRTATDIIDALADQAMTLVEEQNAGLPGFTQDMFVAAFHRTFRAMLDTFLANVDAQNPDLATQIRAAFVAEQNAHIATGDA